MHVKARSSSLVPDSENAALTPKARTQLSLIGFDTRGDLVDLDEGDDPISEMVLTTVDGFPEIPLEVEDKMKNIVVLESRAVTRSAEIFASMRELFRARCVTLVDNMAAALSFERHDAIFGTGLHS